ncbi:putative OB-fold protein [Loktanella ponticola]|uniref:Putative OB-fold protein n=1 Tax=Yoonia ponticola TaxID=1524255 RepID=A0A7W9EZN2_9RHOB|nr:zinc ribbon domain-containing protein [Yoonia ponticola]MBB5723997.1 putative OB-fold protein [Yoonia ponticola]
MKHQLKLDYTIPFGGLQPYFDALHDGKALASACNSCGSVAFPARTQCGNCRSSDMKWVRLNGTARVLFRTDASAGSFALVKFDGADTSSTVALDNPENDAMFGTIVAPKDGAPGLWLTLVDTENEEHDGR